MPSHTFLIKRLESLKGTIERKRTRLKTMERIKVLRKSTKEKIVRKEAELEQSIDELERLIDRLKFGG